MGRSISRGKPIAEKRHPCKPRLNHLPIRLLGKDGTSPAQTPSLDAPAHFWPRVVQNRIWLKGLLLFLGSFLLYLITRSPGLDEIDSVNFAMGVRHFDLWQHQPYSPGYSSAG